MKVLIVEDDFTNRKVLQKYLEPFAKCDVAVDGREALETFSAALRAGEPYELVFLDIMMPQVDGHAVLRGIRELESSSGVVGDGASKVIMTTALDDSSNVLGAFSEGCEAYVVKPIDKQKLYHELRKLGCID
jgi:two-component system chemotaxis response regulator CheY